MAVIHIPEEEAARDLSSLLARVAEGDEIVIEGPHHSARLVFEESPKARSGTEILKILARLPRRSPVDDEFAHDVMSFRERHSEPLDSSKWD